MPKFSFGPPLQLGVASQEEFFDLYLTEDLAEADLTNRFGSELPPGLEITSVVKIKNSERSLSESLRAQRYRATWHSRPNGLLTNGDELDEAVIEKILQLEVYRTADTGSQKGGKKGKKPKEDKKFLLGQHISEVVAKPEALEFTLLFDQQRASPKPIEITNAISELQIGDYSLEKIASYFS